MGGRESQGAVTLRVRRYRAKKKQNVTASALKNKKKTAVTAVTPPTTTLSPREESFLLFPESLTLSPRVRAGVCVRARVAIPMPEILTEEEIELFRSEVRRYRPEIDAEGYVVNFHAHYAATPDREGNLKLSFWWLVTLRSWLMKDLERRQSKFEVGTLGNAEREKRQVETALGAMTNGAQRSGNSECVRAAVAGVFSARSGNQLQNMGTGDGNVIRGAFSAGLPGQHHGADTNLQTAALRSGSVGGVGKK